MSVKTVLVITKSLSKVRQWDSIVGQSAFSFKKKSVTAAAAAAAAAAATVDQVSLTILNPLLGFSLTLRYSQYRPLPEEHSVAGIMMYDNLTRG